MKKMVLIIDYGMGNTGSVQNALEAVGVTAKISADPRDLSSATHIILPGVGAFAECMRNLRERGFIEALKQEVIVKRKPYLGICLGMQILASVGTEGGFTTGLGWIRGETTRLVVEEQRFPVPHVGWNDVVVQKESKLFSAITRPIFYFVHSFYFSPEDKSCIIAYTEYGQRFAVAVQQDTIVGVQFHPEKSQNAGLSLLSNFMNL